MLSKLTTKMSVLYEIGVVENIEPTGHPISARSAENITAVCQSIAVNGEHH